MTSKLPSLPSSSELSRDPAAVGGAGSQFNLCAVDSLIAAAEQRLTYQFRCHAQRHRRELDQEALLRLEVKFQGAREILQSYSLRNAHGELISDRGVDMSTLQDKLNDLKPVFLVHFGSEDREFTCRWQISGMKFKDWIRKGAEMPKRSKDEVLAPTYMGHIVLVGHDTEDDQEQFMESNHFIALREHGKVRYQEDFDGAGSELMRPLLRKGGGPAFGKRPLLSEAQGMWWTAGNSKDEEFVLFCPSERAGERDRLHKLPHKPSNYCVRKRDMDAVHNWTKFRQIHEVVLDEIKVRKIQGEWCDLNTEIWNQFVKGSVKAH